MNANELNQFRRGNYIYYKHIDGYIDKQVCRIHNIVDDYCTDESLSVITPPEILPIPLTEELLLKCGAKYSGFADDFKEIKEYDLGDGIRIDFYVKINEVDVYYCNSIIECYDDKEIKLHQLQNLYFVLTQKELKLNL